MDAQHDGSQPPMNGRAPWATLCVTSPRKAE
jgi:hypothetical protein